MSSINWFKNSTKNEENKRLIGIIAVIDGLMSSSSVFFGRPPTGASPVPPLNEGLLSTRVEIVVEAC
jgi:hypothetical protein